MTDITPPNLKVDMSQVRIIPNNYNCIGTCGTCGGPVIQEMFWMGGSPPPKHCMDCGAQAKEEIVAKHGPILEMR